MPKASNCEASNSQLPKAPNKNNVKCVFQVSPVAASDPAAGKKQDWTKDRPLVRTQRQKSAALKDNIKLRIAKHKILNCRRHQNKNNVKCVFQVSPVAASDPATGKKQDWTIDRQPRLTQRQKSAALNDNIKLRIAKHQIHNCRRHQIIKCKVCVSSFPSRSFRPCGWKETKEMLRH